MEKYHGIQISKSTLLKKLKEYGLQRRGNTIDRDHVRRCIREELDGSGKLLGYRAMWKRLKTKYDLQIPRLVVQTILRELDPEGSRLRKANRLRRRSYVNPGPNYCWHADEYDKLKPYGFPIQGCIDGFSKKIMWLKIVRSSNDLQVVLIIDGNYFLIIMLLIFSFQRSILHLISVLINHLLQTYVFVEILHAMIMAKVLLNYFIHKWTLTYSEHSLCWVAIL